MGCTSGVVIAPSASTLAPMIRGEPDMVGLLLGSRELLYLSSRISRTLVSCSSLSELSLPGESVSCQIQGESVDWWSNITFIASQDGGVFQGGSARHTDVASIRGSTRQVGRLQVQGLDTSRRCHLTGERHTTSSPPTRVHTFSVAICRQVFHHTGSARCSYSVD